MRKKASETMVQSSDKVAHEVAVDDDLANGVSLRRLNLNIQMKDIAKICRTRREEQMLKVMNGKALDTMEKSYIKREWLWYGSSMKSNNRIVCWKILLGMLPVNLSRTRGRANRNVSTLWKLCRN